MTTGVLLVDDHVAIAQALESAFRNLGFDPVEHVPAASLEPEAVVEQARRLRPDVALVDLNLGHGRSGLPIISALTGAGVKVLAFSAYDDETLAAQSIEAGALGFFNKAEPFEVIADHVARAARGESLLSVSRHAQLVDIARAARSAQDARRQRFDTLTPREREVLARLVRGQSAQDIADELVTSIRTVRKQIESVRTKLGVRSQLAAVALAREVGWHTE